MAHAHGNTATITLGGTMPYIATTTTHPRASGQPTVVLDEGFAVKVERSTLKHVSNAGRLHAAHLKPRDAHSPIPLIVALPQGTGRSVVVFASTKLPKNVHLHVQFRTAVVASTEPLASDRTSALVELTIGHNLHLFAEDGSVVEYRCDGRTLVKQPLTIEQMAELRIGEVFFNSNGTLRNTVQDALLHELANIYQFAGKNADVRERAMQALYNLLDRHGWELRPTVMNRIGALLRPHPIHFHGLNELLRGALERSRRAA